jgi:hypothetical protein
LELSISSYACQHLAPILCPAPIPTASPYFHARHLLLCPAPISMPGTYFHARSLFPYPFPAPIATTYLHYYLLLPAPIPIASPYFYARHPLPCLAPTSMPGAYFSAHLQLLLLLPICTTAYYYPPLRLKLSTLSWQHTLLRRAGSALRFRALCSTLWAARITPSPAQPLKSSTLSLYL